MNEYGYEDRDDDIPEKWKYSRYKPLYQFAGILAGLGFFLFVVYFILTVLGIVEPWGSGVGQWAEW